MKTIFRPSELQDLNLEANLASINNARKILNVDGKNTSEIFMAYTDLLKNNPAKSLEKLTNAKNILMRAAIEMMVEKTGKFNLTDLLEFKDSCPACKGTGELYKFFRTETVVDCKFCDQENGKATGKKTILCKSCEGSGMYKEGVPCRACDKDEQGKPSGKKLVICRRCRGTKEFHKITIDSRLKSTTCCNKCGGLGHFQQKKENVIMPINPVISVELADKIKQISISEKEVTVDSASV